MGLERGSVLGLVRTIDVSAEKLSGSVEILSRSVQDLRRAIQHVALFAWVALVCLESMMDRISYFRSAATMAIKRRQVQPIARGPLADLDGGLVLTLRHIELPALLSHAALDPMRRSRIGSRHRFCLRQCFVFSATQDSRSFHIELSQVSACLCIRAIQLYRFLKFRSRPFGV